MKKQNLKPYKEYKKDFEKDLDFILSEVRSYYPKFQKYHEDRIVKAFWYGEKAHREQIRFSGEPYYIHPIAATKILLSIKPDTETIAACLLHDVIEDTPITGEDIEEAFGESVRFLCEGVEKIAKVRLQGKEREHESLRKLFIAMAKDIRVIFIKLADRIHNLSTLEFVRQEKRVRIAKESLAIYAPVAEKLGLFEFKTLIEDQCFKNIHPDRFKEISDQIWKTGEDRKKFTIKAKAEIKDILEKEGVKVINIEGRPKNIRSVYQKMKRKNFTRVDEIYDLFAIRVIVETNTDCYRVLGVIHSAWKPIPSRFKDYIAVPKTNGYRSLHTTVLGLGRSKLPTEIQIRTEAMHSDAEYGPAAHWIYKKMAHSNFDENYIKKLSWFPRNLSQGDEIPDSAEYFNQITASLSLDRIHIFTPKGDLKDLPAKSTPVDFAYAIHSEVGDSCIGAKINGVIKPLNYELKTGDIIEVMTKEGRTPNPLWLKFVKSSHALQCIRGYINRTGEDYVLPATPKKMETVAKPIKKRATGKKVKTEKNTSALPEVVIGGERGMSYRIGSCCKPLPGEDIVAYNSRGLDFMVHESDCNSLNKLDSRRFIEAHFRVEYELIIKATDRVGVFRDCINVISDHGINITESHMVYEKKQTAVFNFKLECSSNRELSEIELSIQKVPNVFEVKIVDK